MFRNILHLGDKVLESQSRFDVGYCQWRGRGSRVLWRYVHISLIELFLLEFYLAIYVIAIDFVARFEFTDRSFLI